MKNFIKLLTPLKLFLTLTLLSGTLNTQDFNINSDTTWKYLGRPRPGMTPLRFPPDSLLANNNWNWHGTLVFSPDLKEMFWCKYNHFTGLGELAFIKYINGSWTPIQNAPFGNQNYWEAGPFFFYSNDTLFFTSHSPGGFVFRTCRISSGWTTPEAINIPIPAGYIPGADFSIAQNGTIYFGLRSQQAPLRGDIYKSKFINGQYQLPENLGNIINSDSADISPYIDPYERFMILSSNRPGGYGSYDLYISKRNPDDTWNTPINLGTAINSNSIDGFPSITPDGMYFFYITDKNQQIGLNPFWISSQYIYNLAAIGINNPAEIVPEKYILYQNYPNPFNPSTKIKFSIPSSPLEGGKGDDFVKLNIYDVLGKEIVSLIPSLGESRSTGLLTEEGLSPGTYEVEWNAECYPSGIYFYTLTAGTFKATKKMIMIK